MDNFNRLEELYGEDFADAIDTASEMVDPDQSDHPLNKKRKSFYLAVLFSMPLPVVGAADELIKYIQDTDSDALAAKP